MKIRDDHCGDTTHSVDPTRAFGVTANYGLAHGVTTFEREYREPRAFCARCPYAFCNLSNAAPNHLCADRHPRANCDADREVASPFVQLSEVFMLSGGRFV
jgi:hypothetical protein